MVQLERAQRGRGDYGHGDPSRNVGFRRNRRSTSKIKRKGGRGNPHTGRSSMTDDLRNPEWFGGRQRSAERGRRRQHQRESSRRRRVQHASPYKRSSLDQSRKAESRAEYESSNSRGFFGHGEGSGNPHPLGDREEGVAREGSVPEQIVGQGIRYPATHDNSYGQEIYGTPGKYIHDQFMPYAAAGPYNTLQYPYGTGISDADHVRNGNTNASQDDTLREFGTQNTTTVAYQTPTLPFEHPSSKPYDHQYTNSNSNQIRSEFISPGDNSYEIPGILHTSSAVQRHGNASPVSATSAMSISSGRSPRSVFSNNRSDTSSRKGPICIKCQKPECSPLDLMVNCSRCLGSYHTSCRDPTISVTRGVINVDSRIWKCQRCATRLTNPGNGPHRQSVSPTRSRPRKIPRLSTNASDASSGRLTNLSKGSTRMAFSLADLQEDGSARDENDHSRDPKPQLSMGGVPDLYGARVSEPLRNSGIASQWSSLVATATLRDWGDNLAHRTGDGISSTRPIGTSDQRMLRYSSRDCPSEFGGGVERRFDVPELTYYSDGMSRSANVFSGRRKLAVVIDNRSRSGSASTNGYQGEVWNRTPPAVKDPRDDVTPIPHSKLRQTLGSPAPQEFSQLAVQTPLLGGANASTLRRRRLKRPRSSSEVLDPQEELERSSIDDPINLEPLKDYRDRRNPWQPANGCRSLPSERPGKQTQVGTAGDSRHERLQRRLNRTCPPDTHNNEESPRSRPSSSSYKGKEIVECPTTERTGVPSPHYSPPPPDAGANGSLSHHHNETDRLSPKLQAVRARSSSIDIMLSCRRCGSDIAIINNKRADICSSCVRREHCRGSDLTDTTSREPSHSTAPSHHSPAPSYLPLRIDGKNGPPSRHSSSLSAPGLLDNCSNTTPNSDSLPSDISRGCTPQELPPVEVFLTAKQRVIEKYQMKFPEITTGGLPSQPIKETAIRGQKARKVMNLPKPKVATTAEKLKTAVPLKKNRVNATTLAQASPRVDSRKSINGSTLPDILSAAEPPKHNTRMTVMSISQPRSISQPKKPTRKGPAIKHARGSISRVFITDDSSSESDHSGKLRALEKRLQDQKSYTKNQAEKAAKLQIRLQESEKEKAALQEKLKAFLALGNHEANERPALGNENPQPGVITELLPTQGSQPEPPKKKALKRLVRWEEAHSDRTALREDPQTEPGAADDKPDTSKRTFRYGSMRDFYSGSKFCGEDPWAYPTTPERPEPDPSTFRKHGWRKTAYRPFDQGRLMKVHLHRLTSHTRPPLTMTIEESPLGDDDEFASTPDTPIGTRVDRAENKRGPIAASRVISFDGFMGLPENMVPTVKDGCLGFRSGIINPRTGRLERNAPHYRIRAPGDLKPT